MATICLNMIVKNESKEIIETLNNIISKVKIDYWVISDTGSTDNTISLIENFFSEHQIPGELYRDEWENFGKNRQKALKHAEGKSDYVFFFDADDRIEGNLELNNLTSRGYYLYMTDENKITKYHRALIVKNDGSYYWRGVLHEFLNDSKKEKYDTLNGDYIILSRRTSSRNQDNDKYKKDALVLEKAIYWYKKRAEHLGWDQELFQTHYRLGIYYDSVKEEAISLHHYMKASAAYPKAIEPWYQLARINNWSKRHDLAYIFSLRATEAVEANKENYLFQNISIKKYWAYYELFINAYAVNNIERSYYAFKKLILADAPENLYKNEITKIKSFEKYINNDSFETVKKIKSILQNKNMDELISILGL